MSSFQSNLSAFFSCSKDGFSKRESTSAYGVAFSRTSNLMRPEISNLGPLRYKANEDSNSPSTAQIGSARTARSVTMPLASGIHRFPCRKLVFALRVAVPRDPLPASVSVHLNARQPPRQPVLALLAFHVWNRCLKELRLRRFSFRPKQL